MKASFDARDLTAALDQLKQAGDAAVQISPESPLPDKEWQKREALKVKMIAQRVKLKLMRDRTDELKQALERFRTQRNAMSA
jgi:peroxiredoxin